MLNTLDIKHLDEYGILTIKMQMFFSTEVVA